MTQTYFERPSHRAPNEMRPISFLRNYTTHAEGSVLVCFGNTKVLCTASIIEGVPRFLRDSHQGWLTAEYGMLPRSTHTRTDREASKGKQAGRTIEIQRLIGRALRAAVNLNMLGNHTITIDCDVLQADGGTRTAAISGACVALVDALRYLHRPGSTKDNPLKYLIAGVSVGICKQVPLLDLDYAEDCQAQTDMNVVMTDTGSFIEIQGTAENKTFTEEELNNLMILAKQGIKQIITAQKAALEITEVAV